MRTAEARDKMVTRVKAAFAEHPTFESWPESERAGDLVAAIKPPFDQRAYIEALHEICASGKPVGRIGKALTGARIGPEDPEPSGKRIVAGAGAATQRSV